LPVLSPEEVSKESSIIPSSHPDLSNSPRTVHHASSELSVIDPGTHTDEILKDLGISNEWIQRLGQEGVFGGTLKRICKL
jgi:alpha-methylacyl-CoA racemase